jgi:hypothetical protein
VEQLSVWLGTGLVTAGVSAALLAGAGAASAETGPGGEPGGSGASASSASSSSTHSSNSTGPSNPNDPKTRPKPASGDGEPTSGESDSARPETDAKDDTAASEVKHPDTPKPTESATHDSADRPTTRSAPAKRDRTKGQQPVEAPSPKVDAAVATTAPDPVATRAAAAVEKVSETVATESVPVTSTSFARPTPTKLVAAAAPAPPSLVGVIQGVIGAVVVNVGSLVFHAVQAVEALVTGPPVVPPGSTVTVRISTVQLSNGQRVAANWFYPKTDDGAPPANTIYLQHGFFALGPMYSYTAANLAQETKSVVVTTTLTSNPFAGDSVWLGGTGTAAAIADLFVGDRAALTASAIEAGYATTYGLDPATARLPQRFALAGHSLGANLVSAAAGFLVDKGAAADLVGVILLDGVPVGATLPTALAKLDGYAASTGGHYVPVREIGAPWNLYNSTSTVNADLAAARPNRFNGVVLDGGVHSDATSGGNSLIQFALYVAAGFPQPQDPLAVGQLCAQWLNEWFGEHTDVGDDLTPGTTIGVSTPRGIARGVVIGSPRAARQVNGPVAIAPSAPTSIPTPAPILLSA